MLAATRTEAVEGVHWVLAAVLACALVACGKSALDPGRQSPHATAGPPVQTPANAPDPDVRGDGDGLDASVHDAGGDAALGGVADAGMMDAGMMDAGMMDAGMMDAGAAPGCPPSGAPSPWPRDAGPDAGAFTLGWGPAPVGAPRPVTDNALFAQPVQVTRDVDLIGLAIHTPSDAGAAYLALYTDADGMPGSFLNGIAGEVLPPGPGTRFRSRASSEPYRNKLVGGRRYWVVANMEVLEDEQVSVQACPQPAAAGPLLRGNAGYPVMDGPLGNLAEAPGQIGVMLVAEVPSTTDLPFDERDSWDEDGIEVQPDAWTVRSLEVTERLQLVAMSVMTASRPGSGSGRMALWADDISGGSPSPGALLVVADAQFMRGERTDRFALFGSRGILLQPGRYWLGFNPSVAGFAVATRAEGQHTVVTFADRTHTPSRTGYAERVIDPFPSPETRMQDVELGLYISGRPPEEPQ